MLGLARLHPQPVPADPWFLLHFSLVLALLVYFPFSKLMHAGGIFFSPSRNQIDWTRSTERRHVSPFENTKSA
jgi:nitrate reductase gamma subunit